MTRHPPFACCVQCYMQIQYDWTFPNAREGEILKIIYISTDRISVQK